MHIFVVHPGASFSTNDVYEGIVAGLRAQGHDVSEGRLDHLLAWHGVAMQYGVSVGAFDPAVLRTDSDNSTVFAMSAAHITRAATIIRPDLVLVVSGHNFVLADVLAMRRAGLRTAVVLTESPYFGEIEAAIARCYDVVFTNERKATTALRSASGDEAHYLAHAYHPTRHTPHGPYGEAHDVVFVGSLFGERKTLIEGVNWQGIDLLVRGIDVEGSGRIDLVDNADVAALYRSARIALNMHRTTTLAGSGIHVAAGEAESINPRAYEIPAVGGALMVCDDSRPELFDVYGESAVTYRAGDSADLERVIRYYLDNEPARRRAADAQHAAVAPHSWAVRAAQIVEAVCR
jgi:spore maturation protein CgeB